MRALVPPANLGDVRLPPLGLQYRFVGGLAGSIMDALLATAHWDVQGDEPFRQLVAARRPFIFTFFHRSVLILGHLHRGGRYAMMISLSKDGEYGAALARHWGQIPVRGSSSRGGGTALLEMMQEAAAGRSLCFTPDGPRGPRSQVKAGVIIAAQRTGLPIIPFSADANRRWLVRSWDRLIVPKPFARVRVRYGAPLYVAPDEPVEPRRRELELELLRLSALAEGRFEPADVAARSAAGEGLGA